MTRAASPGRAVLALAAYELRLAARRGENLLVTLVVPAAVLVFFSTVGAVEAVARPVDRLLPGALALGVIATSFDNLGIATAYERHYGVLKRLGGAPLPRGAIVVAKIMAVVAIEVAQVVLLIALARFVLGWRPGPDPTPLVAVAALLLGTAAFAGLGLAMAGRLRAEATLALANGLFLAFLLVGGIVVPVEQLPAPLAAIAGALPAAHLAELWAIGLGSGRNPVPSLLVLVGWAAVAVAVAIRAFRWE